MLVLTLRVEESVRVGSAEVRILEIHRGRVRLGVRAGREVPVWRRPKGRAHGRGREKPGR